MAHPKEVRGFRIIAPVAVSAVILNHFDVLLQARQLKLRPLVGHPNLEFGSSVYPKRIDFSVFADGKCVGYTAFGKITEPVLSGLAPDLVKPHAQMLPAYQKKGITKSFYLSMLHNGYSLATESHTAAAAALWDSIARELEIPIMHWDRHLCEWVPKSSPKTLKVITVRDLENA